MRVSWKAILFTAAILFVLMPVTWSLWNIGLQSLRTEATITTELASLSIDLTGTPDVTVGRAELAQRPGLTSAETDHLNIKLQDGRLQLRNAAKQRRLLIQYSNGFTPLAAKWHLRSGDEIRLRGSTIFVDSTRGGHLSIRIRDRDAERSVRLATGGFLKDVLTVNDKEHALCDTATYGPQNVLKRLSSNRVVLHIGGLLNCFLSGVHNVPLKDLEWRGLVITSEDKKLPFETDTGTEDSNFFLSPGRIGASNLADVEFRRRGAIVQGFNNIWWPLTHIGKQGTVAHIERLTLGKTKYRVKLTRTGDRPDSPVSAMLLTPLYKNHLFRLRESASTRANCPPDFPGVPSVRDQVNSKNANETGAPHLSNRISRCLETPGPVFERGNGADPFKMISREEYAMRLALCLTPLLLLTGMAGYRIAAYCRRRFSGDERAHVTRRDSKFFFSFLLTGLISLVILYPDFVSAMNWRPIGLIDGLVFNVIGALLLIVALAFNHSNNLPLVVSFIATLFLIAFGTLVLLSLSLDGETTHWLQYIAKHKLLFLDGFMVLAMACLTLPLRSLDEILKSYLFLSGRTGRIVLIAISSFPIGLIVYWGLNGSEEGVAGLQPVELIKTLIIIFFATMSVTLIRVIGSSNRRDYFWYLVYSFVNIAIVLFVLVGLPSLKNDYSPVLIVTIISLVMFIVFMFPWGLRRIGETSRIAKEKSDAPYVPRVKKASRQEGLFLGIAACLISLAILFVGWNIDKVFSFGLTGHWEFADDKRENIRRLEAWKRYSFSNVVSDRFIAFFDLGHDDADRVLEPKAESESEKERVFTVDNIDIGLQILRSKIALSNSPCGLHQISNLAKETQDTLATLSRHLTQDRCKSTPLAFDPGKFGQNETEADAGADQGPNTIGDTDNSPTIARSQFYVDDLTNLPVVQNDFIGAYLVTRFGVVAFLAAIVAQVTLIFAIVLQAFKVVESTGMGQSEQLLRLFFSRLLVGIATLLALHWIIAWSNVFGLLPVMGQPMSLIAAATSHHVFTITPCLLAILFIGRHTRPQNIRFRSGPSSSPLISFSAG